MAVLGGGTIIGLWVLGVPLAFTLGLFTGLMIFMPYIGSWIAFIPTVLVSLTVGPQTAVYVTIPYLVIHGIEGYVLTPLVQKRAVLLPPVLTILAQLFIVEGERFSRTSPCDTDCGRRDSFSEDALFA